MASKTASAAWTFSQSVRLTQTQAEAGFAIAVMATITANATQPDKRVFRRQGRAVAPFLSWLTGPGFCMVSTTILVT